MPPHATCSYPKAGACPQQPHLCPHCLPGAYPTCAYAVHTPHLLPCPVPRVPSAPWPRAAQCCPLCPACPLPSAPHAGHPAPCPGTPHGA
ncbi:hypothetical protein FREDWARD_104 [Mycobacterium phage Fredward]|uniref:hypothetical protein n=1 Tax=Mycobacterium phage Fredward TaxID=1354510 RepID=UPI0003BA07E1|nr:hypothetical protein V424_gp004 [Mycobacterium phage Fredward]AGY37051.1 hypothetical protein FREDWARD_104 [Mycobacterium phage Fredward]